MAPLEVSVENGIDEGMEVMRGQSQSKEIFRSSCCAMITRGSTGNSCSILMHPGEEKEGKGGFRDLPADIWRPRAG
jgi:hypothetical protein